MTLIFGPNLIHSCLWFVFSYYIANPNKLLQVHYKTQFEALVDENTTGAFPLFEFKHPHHMVDLSAHLMNMGYAVQVRDDNQRCKHCMEVTLTRFRCPGSGVYALS